ncbi:recombinase family protein [Paraburkholderia unamae]|uniref:Recombinase family protein n=1 Tax=Paraburkholderia unamae TaxID=219649 RepID=A0ACC6RPZ9_9BURK
MRTASDPAIVPSVASTTARVYSYLRFSDPKQAYGASAERQTEYAAQWAAKNGLKLDRVLSLRDEGLSAYHQKHIKNGALGTFLRAVEQGLVPAGSVLVVESLDRLSRAAVSKALTQLLNIINAGLRVVTAADNREYSEATVDSNPTELIVSITIMMRAFEESDTKAGRVRDAMRRRVRAWQDGTWRGVLGSGKNPNWTRVVEDENGKKRIELIPERVAAVHMALDLFRAGHGLVRIAQGLEEVGMLLSEKSMSQVIHVRNLLRLEALYGRRIVTVAKDESYALDGYYPEVISPEEFAEIQMLLNQRVRYGSKSTVTAVISGLGIAVCGHCEQMIVTHNNYSAGLDERGRPRYRKLLCNSYHKAVACKAKGMIAASVIERAVMECCSIDFNLEHLLRADPKHDALLGKLAVAKRDLVKLEKQRDNYEDAIGEAENKEERQRTTKRYREAMTQVANKRATIEKLEYELVRTAGGETPASADLWRSLLNGVVDLDEESRKKARRLFSDTFERIDVYNKGYEGDMPEFVDMELLSKRGGVIAIRINRKTGAWEAKRLKGKREQAAAKAA